MTPEYYIINVKGSYNRKLSYSGFICFKHHLSRKALFLFSLGF